MVASWHSNDPSLSQGALAIICSFASTRSCDTQPLRAARYLMRSRSSRQCRPHGKLAKSLPLQWIPNRPSDLLNSTRGNPRGRARTPLRARAVLAKIRKMVSERLRPHRGWRGFYHASSCGKRENGFAKRTQRTRAGSLKMGRKHL